METDLLERRRLWIGLACLVALAVAAGTVVNHGSQGGWSAASTAAASAIIGTPSSDRRTALPPQQDRLYGAPARGWRLEGRVLGSSAYRRYYPGTDNVSEVKQAGLEPGPPQRLRVVATYEAAAGLATNIAFGGLCNQIYSHVNMLAVLLHMGAELVLPDAVHRGGHGFGDSFWANKVVPVRAPLGSLFDVDHLLAWAASAGAVLHTAPPSLDGAIAVNVSGSSICCGNTMDYIVGVIHDAVFNATRNFLALRPERDREAPKLVIALTVVAPMLMSALRMDGSHMELVEEVTRNLRPSPAVRAAADGVLAHLTAGGAAFNGLHLRLEDDTGIKQRLGGEQPLFDIFLATMQGASYNASTPLYVASGLLTYLSQDEFNSSVTTQLVQQTVCSEVVIKEHILDDRLMVGLLSEALAFVDLVVLTHARHFTGLIESSFSYVVQELRCLDGLPPSTTAMARIPRRTVPEALVMGGALSNHSCTCPEHGNQLRRV